MKINKFFLFFTSIIYFSICYAETYHELSVNNAFLFSSEKHYDSELIFSNGFYYTLNLENSSFIFDNLLHRNIKTNEKWNHNTTFSYVKFINNFSISPFLSINRRSFNKLDNNIYGLSTSFFSEFDNKLYDYNLEFYNQENLNLSSFNSQRLNFNLKQSYFFSKTSFHHDLMFSVKNFREKRLSLLNNSIIYSIGLNNDTGLSFCLFNTLNINTTSDSLYSYKEQHDDFTYNQTALYIRFSRIVNLLLLSLKAESGYMDYLENSLFLQEDKSYLTLTFYSDYPLFSNFILSGNILIYYSDIASLSLKEYSLSVNLRLKI